MIIYLEIRSILYNNDVTKEKKGERERLEQYARVMADRWGQIVIKGAGLIPEMGELMLRNDNDWQKR